MGLMVSVLSLKPDLCQDPYEGLPEGLSGRNHTRQPTDVGSCHLELHLNVAEKERAKSPRHCFTLQRPQRQTQAGGLWEVTGLRLLMT